jgi:hypothetical protein
MRSTVPIAFLRHLEVAATRDHVKWLLKSGDPDDGSVPQLTIYLQGESRSFACPNVLRRTPPAALRSRGFNPVLQVGPYLRALVFSKSPVRRIGKHTRPGCLGG